MPRRLFALALALVFFLTFFPTRAPAQTDSGAITIQVVDTSTTQGLSDVRVFLTGAVIASALTEKSGVVKYTDVPVGIYRVRVIKRGYQLASSNEFEVLNGKDVTVKFALRPTPTSSAQAGSGNENLKVIGAVTVTSNVQISTNDISDESPIRRLSDSMTDALDKLAGVSVNQDSNDPDSAVTISLNGHDESQTAITLDGIPLSAPGVATNLRNVGTDLFSGASTSFSPSAGGLGGSVNFRTLEPTQSWNERFSSTYGTYDRWNYALAATGSVGRLGLAVMHTSRGSNNPLTFQDYEDTSGLTYPHGGYSTSLGDMLKVRYRIGDSATLTGSLLQANNSFSSLCTAFVTTLPCGIGPGNGSVSRFAFGYATLSSLVGNVALTGTAFFSANRNTNNQLDRIIAGVPDPFESTGSSHTNGYAFTASLGQSRHTFSLSGNTYSSSSAFSPLFGSPFVIPSATGINAHQFQFKDVVKSNDKLSLNYSASLADTSGIGSSVLGGIGSSWRPNRNDTYQLALALGSAQPGSTLPRTLSDPVSARFNCDAGTSIVSGPGDSPQSQSSISYNFDWTHQWRTGQITMNAFRQTQIGQTINALINSAGEPSDYFTPGYITAIQQAWAAPTNCGTIPFNPVGVYVNQPISGTARLYQGVNLSGRIALGRNVVALPTYSINDAILIAADSRLTSAQSTSILGQQLPGRPIHRAGLTLDALLTHSGIELLGNVQYTGGDNSRNLVPYSVVNAGISHPFGSGRLTVFASNLFNAVSGEFSTLQYAQPVPVSGGGVVFFAANPLTPRQISANYTINVGKGSRPAQSSLSESARQAARQAGGGFGGPGGGGPGGPGGGPGGPGGPRGGPGGPGAFRPNVLPAGGDPFSLATANAACNPAAQGIANPILSALRAYVTAYEAKQTTPAFEGFEVIPHANASGSGVTYWLELRPAGGPPGAGRPGGPGTRRAPGGDNVSIENAPVVTRTPAPAPSASAPAEAAQNGPAGAARFRAIFACMYLTLLTQDEAKAKGIDTQGRIFLGYAPGIGIFGVRPRQLPQGGGSIQGGSAP